MSRERNFDIVPMTELAQKRIYADTTPQRPVVLVVDDEIVIADTLAAILNSNGYAATPAYNGRSALELAKLIPPNLLITDVMMPGMNGIELAIQIKALCSDCKVLLFSGQAGTTDLLAQARAEGHDFNLLAKPIHPRELLATISPSGSDPMVRPTNTSQASV